MTFRAAACLLLLGAGLSAQAATPAVGTVVVVVSGRWCDARVTAIDVHQESPSDAKWFLGRSFEFSLTANNVYQIKAETSWLCYDYSSSPFLLSAGQVVAHEIRPSLWIESVPVILAGVASIVLALFTFAPGMKERLVRLSQRPLLRVYCDSKPPHTHPASYPMKLLHLPTARGAEFFVIYHARPWVQNEGSGEARNVEVFVRRIFTATDAGYEEEHDFLAHNLRWANTWDSIKSPRRVDSHASLNKARIAIGIGRFCDLGFVVQPDCRAAYFRSLEINADLKEGNRVVFEFAFDALTGDGSHRLPLEEHPDSKRFVIEVVVDADNSNPEYHYIQMEIERWRPPAQKDPPVKLAMADPQTAARLARTAYKLWSK